MFNNLRSGLVLVALTGCGVTPAPEDVTLTGPSPTATASAAPSPDAATAPAPTGATPPTDPPPSVPACASQCPGNHSGASNVQAWSCNAKNECVIAACAASFRNCNGLVNDGCEESSTNGQCAPIQLQAPTGGGAVAAISTSDTEIYWMTSANTVRHCPKAGCPSFAAYTVPFTANGFVAVGDDLYFAAYQGIMHCPGTGCAGAPTVLVAEQALEITAASGSLYWGTPNGSIRSCPVTGCGANGPVQIAKGGIARDISVSKDFVAWATFGQPLQVCPLAGCPTAGPTKLPGTATGYLDTVHIYDGNVYWAGGGTINVCPPTGCTAATKLAPSGISFQVDETSLYYTKGTVVERCPRAGCSASSQTALASGLPANAATFAQDDTMLYLAGYNTVFKVAK